MTATGSQPDGLSDYLSRPRLIYSYGWNSGGTSVGIFPWHLFFGSNEMAAKYHYLSLFKGVLVVRFIVSGTPFNYGRDVAGYFPRYLTNKLDNNTDFAAIYLRQHVELDPSGINAQELRLPFVYERPFLPLTGQSTTAFTDMGAIWIKSISVLASTATPTPAPLTVQLYAWLEDTELGGPSPVLFSPSGPKAGANETGSGPVTRVSTAVQTAAGALKKVPVLGAAAGTVEAVARGIGGLASMFGLSRPTQIDPPTQVRQLFTGQMANAIGPDPAAPLTLDPLQGLQITGPSVGFGPADEMSYASFTSKWAFLAGFEWSQATAAGATIGVIGVGPCASFNPSGTTFRPSPAGYLALVHEFWTGSMEYRVCFVANKYLSGRMLIRYVPYFRSGIGATVEPYTSASQDCCVVDLANETEIIIQVPWAQPDVVLPTGLATAGLHSPTYDRAYHNGYLEFVALSPLQAPLPTASVDVNIFVHAGSDFQVLVPDLSRQAGYTASGPDDIGRSTVQPPRVCRITPGVQRSVDPAVTVVGEQVASIRALCKRYAYIGNTNATGATAVGSSYDVHLTLDTRPADVDRVTGFFLMTTGYTGYFARCFQALRGGMRYKVHSSTSTTAAYHEHYIFAARGVTDGTNGTDSVLLPMDVAVVPPGSILLGCGRGAVLVKNTQGAVEVMIPDYQPNLFKPAWVLDYVGSAPFYTHMDTLEVDLCYVADAVTGASGFVPSLFVYESIGEDFSMFWFQGVPIMTR